MEIPRLESKLLSASIVALFLLLGCGEGTAPVSLPKKASLPCRRSEEDGGCKDGGEEGTGKGGNLLL